MNSGAVVQRQLASGISPQGEITAVVDALAYVEERLISEPHAITPVEHIARDFNTWWPGQQRWSVNRVGRLLTRAGLPLSQADFRGRYGISCVPGWRLSSDTSFAEFLTRVEPAPDQAALVADVAAAFNDTAPIGGAWTDERMAATLNDLGFRVLLKRRNGAIDLLVDHHRLAGPKPKRPGRRLLRYNQEELLKKFDTAPDLAALPCSGLTLDRRQRLAAAGIRTRDELADLAADELQQILGAGLSSAAAAEIIMAARAHWFTEGAHP